jgi:Spy/CpxP family protein refolding chaperone
MTSKLKPVLLLALVFFAGIAVGIIGTRAATRHFFAHRINPDWIADRMERELASELSLTADQTNRIHEIFQESRRELQELRKQFGPRFGEIMKEVEKKIGETLSPEQNAKYEKLLKEKKAQWRPPGGPQKPPFGKPRPGERERERERLGLPPKTNAVSTPPPAEQ